MRPLRAAPARPKCSNKQGKHVIRLATMGGSIVAVVLMANAALADAPTPHHGDEGAKVAGPVWWTHHAFFRLRPEVLAGGDLGPGESPIQPTLSADGDDDPDAPAWASMRLRYEGQLHVGANLRVHLGLDAFDNLVLGSVPTWGRTPPGDDVADSGQAPSSAGDLGWRDSLRVRQLHASCRLMSWMDIDLGRRADHLGLGVQRNEGDCIDCDAGTLIDGVRFAFEAGDMQAEISFESTATGATTVDPSAPGQAHDLAEKDDVDTWTLRVGRGRAGRRERTAGPETLGPTDGWLLDWRLFSAFTDQVLSSSEQPEATLGTDCADAGVQAGGQRAMPVHCWALLRRHASLWRPGLWVRATRRPSHGTRLRIEAEAAAVIGEIKVLQNLEGLDSLSKDISGFGLAVETEYRTQSAGFGLDFGYASGDDRRFLGFQDGQNIVPTGEDLALDDNAMGNDTITSYWFHPDYRLDLILFRQVIGTVTNAIYLKPWIAGDLLNMDTVRLGGRLDVLYARAARPSGSPGQGDEYGLEVDGRIMLALPEGLGLEVAAGVLLPMDALRNRVTGEAAEPAFAVRGLLSWRW